MSEVTARLRAIAADHGLTAWVYATRLDGCDPAAAVSLHGDEPVAIASLYKLPLAVAWAQLVSSGDLDPQARLRLAPGERSGGVTGVAMLLDLVELSQRDAVRLMLAISDNACADAILGLVGLERLNRLIGQWGNGEIVVRRGSAESLRLVQQQTGIADPVLAERALASVERDVTTSEYDAALASSATAAGLCRTLAVLWGRQGAAYDVVRDALGHQAWRHRIGSGFPHDDVGVYGKTGTLARLRHEAAVVTYPGEHPIAVAVLTLAARAERHQPRVDAAMGELARCAVTPLRRAVAPTEQSGVSSSETPDARSAPLLT